MPNILVVDDDPFIASLFSEIIEDAGLNVVGPYSSCAPALAAIAAEPVDAALLDFELLHGETTRPVVDELKRRDVPFLMISGSSRLEAEWPQLRKPVSERQLLSGLEAMLARKLDRGAKAAAI